MARRIPILLLALAALLAACASGPVRRVSEPAASIQELAVQADGSWSVSLRLQNFSSIAMRFDRIDLEVTVGGQAAGTLADAPALQIGPESPDVIAVRMQPEPGARMLLADALAAGRRVDYELDGTITAAPADRGGTRDYAVKRKSALSPTPGLPGVLR